MSRARCPTYEYGVFNTPIVTPLGLARNHTSYVGKTVWTSIETVGVESVNPLGEETSPLQVGHYISLMRIDSEVLHHVLIQLKPQSRTVGHLDKAVYINLHCWG